MALAISEPISNINDATDASSYAFASFTPAANCKLVAIFAVYGHNTDEGTVSDSGMGLTWTKRHRATWQGGASTIYVFEATVGASPAATVVTLTLPTDAATGCGATMFQITGTSVTFVQVASKTGSGAGANVDMGAALNTNNCYVGGAGQANNPPAVTPPASWTETADLGHASSEGHFSAFRVNGETGTNIAWTGGTGAWGLALAEYSEGGGGGGSPIVTKPRFSDLTFNVHVKRRTLGLRPGLSFAYQPIGAAPAASKAVKPHAETLSRAQLTRMIRKGRESSFGILGEAPHGSIVVSGIAFDIVLRRRIVRR